MDTAITEALLEMHFHRAIVGEFEKAFGARFLKLLKPSAKQEAWVGFDQGWVRTSVTPDELFKELKQAIQTQSSTAKHFYLGYFLQFKIVQRMVRGSRYKPSHFTAPYYRSELSMYPNTTTGISQHETLLQLNKVRGASVAYACGMLFDTDDIWNVPDLSKLRCVDISTSPTDWSASQRHFIAF